MKLVTLTAPLFALMIALISVTYADDTPTVDHTYFYRGGLFSQLADCQAVLPAQAKLFQEQTGLTPLATSCVPGRDFEPGHETFTPLIDSTGTPKKHLYPVDTFTKLGMENSPQGMALLHSLIQKREIIALETSDEILYYGSEPLEISIIDISWYKDASECTNQLDTLRFAYQQGGVNTMLGNCFKNDLTDSTRMTVAWTGEDTTVAEDHAFGSAVYPSFQSCMDSMNDAVAKKKATLAPGKHIFGAVCETHENASAENDGYAIDMFTDNF